MYTQFAQLDYINMFYEIPTWILDLNIFACFIIAVIVSPFTFYKQVNFSFYFNHCFMYLWLLGFSYDWFLYECIHHISVNFKHVQCNIWLPDMNNKTCIELNWIVIDYNNLSQAE